MEMTELLAGQIGFALRNIKNNLDFIPDDKLDWKPAPKANSVLEIVNHVAGSIYGITEVMTGSGMKPNFTPAVNREDAKSLLQNGVDGYIAALRGLKPQDMGRTVQLPIGDLPLGAAAGVPVVELINHHGQITYIQTLLGDDESHLVM